jgi:hypothetical protein
MKLNRYLFSLTAALSFALLLFSCFGLNAQTIIQIGTGTGAPSVGVNPGTGANACSPYGTNVGSGANGKKWQAIYTADMINTAMTAASLTPGATSFSTVGFNITGRVGSGYTHQNYTVKMANVAQADLSGGYYTGSFTTVNGPAAFSNNTNGWFSLPIATPFQWDGVSNLCVEVCYNGNTPFLISTYGGCQYTDVGGNNRMGFSGGSGSSCATTLPGTGSLTNRLTNIRLTAEAPVSQATITTGTVSPLTYCAGSAISVPFTSTGTFTAGNSYTIQLSNSSGSFAAPVAIGSLSSTANSGTINGTIPPGTPQGSGYLIRVASTTPAVTGSNSTATITVNAPLTPTFTAIGTVCQNAAAPVLPLNSTNSPAIPGTWSPSIVNTSSIGSTVYTFTPSAGQCATTTTQSVLVSSPILPTFNSISPICQNTTAPVLPTSSTNSPSIAGTWNPVTINTSLSGPSTYTFTPSAGQCASAATLSVQINAPQILTTTPSGNQAICNGGSLPIDAANGFTNYSWSTPGGNQSGQSVSATQAGSFVVSASDVNGCNSIATAVTVSINSVLSITVTPDGPLEFCPGDSVVLSAATGFTGYNWTGTTDTTSSITVSTSGTYSVSANSGNGCLASSAPFVVQVFAVPQAIPVTPAGQITVCDGDSIVLIAGSGYTDYVWTGVTSNDSLIVSEAGTYSVTAFDANGCSAVSGDVVISYDPAFSIGVSPVSPVSLCDGETVVLTAEDGFTNYVWSTSSTDATLSVSSPGIYSVSAENGDGCIGNSLPILVEAVVPPVAAFTYNQTTGYTVDFTCTTPSGQTFFWDFGGITSTEEAPSFTFSFDGTWPVKLIVSNGCGVDTIIVDVVVVKQAGIKDHPTLAFNLQPNPGKENLILVGETSFNQKVGLKVVNILGQTIHQNELFLSGSWSTSVNMAEQSSGVYWIILESDRGRSVRKWLKE